MPYVSPEVRFWLGVAITIASGIASGAATLTNMFPHDWVPYIQAWCAFFSFGGNAILTALNGLAATTSSKLQTAASVPLPERLTNLVNTSDGDIKQIVTSKAVADATPSEKVVSK